MSEENVEIIKRMLDEAQERPAAIYEILDDEVEWDLTAMNMPFPAKGRGPKSVRSFFRSWVGAFEDWGFEVEDLIDGGASVIARIHQWGRGKGSGVAVEGRFWQVWTLREGRVIRVRHHLDKGDALKAAGLRE